MTCISRTRAITHLLCFTLAAAAFGCGGSDPVAPDPISVAISPGATTLNGGAAQSFAATVTNATNTAVTWTTTGGSVAPNGANVTYTAPFIGGSYTLTATSVEDPTKSRSISITVPLATISVSPTPTTLGAGAVQVFTATVGSTTNTSVTWSASAGTLVATGNSASFTAPVTGGNYTITATSVADPSRTAAATITVTPVAVSTLPAATTLYRGEPTTFTATVGGTATTTVTWTATCGTVTGTGLTIDYTPPLTSGECRIIARSALDQLTADTSVVTVRSDWLLSTLDDVNDGACTFTHCSLREAITAANSTAGSEIIRVGLPAAGQAAALQGSRGLFSGRGDVLFNLGGVASITGVGTITLTSALPVITSNVEIVGAGTTQTIIDANATIGSMRRVLAFTGAQTSSVRALTVRGGVTDQGGGGILISSSAGVTLTDVTLTSNETRGVQGGAILLTAAGSAAFNNVVVANNKTVNAGVPGGGIAVDGGSLVMKNGAIRNNTVSDGSGGGVRILGGTVTLEDVEVKDNIVQAGTGLGGGIAISPGSTVTLTRATVTGNSALTEGGGLRVDGAAVTSVGSTFNNNSAPVAAGIFVGNAPAVTITGGTISGNIASQRGGGVLLSGSTSVAITDVDIANNRANNGAGGGIVLQNPAAAQLTDVDVTGNKAFGAVGSGAGAYVESGSTLTVLRGTIANNETDQFGGGVFVSGTVTLNNVLVSGNKTMLAGLGGGISAVNGSVTVRNGQIANNAALGSGGGGVFLNASTALFEDVDIHDNTSQGGGAGINTTLVNNVTLTRTLIRNNTATGNGGAMVVNNGTALIATNVTISGNHSSNNGGGINLSSNSSLVMTGSTITLNTATVNGGGLLTSGSSPINISNSVVSNNTSGAQGGGLQLAGSPVSVLDRVTVSGNTSVGSGGGITAGGNFTLNNSTISGNSSGGTGGGLFSTSTGTIVVKNTTISGNSGAIGGGVGITGNGTLTNVTIIGNAATDFGGGIGSNNAGALTMKNVLLSNNLRVGVPQNCATGNGGIMISGGNNLSNDATCAVLTMPTDNANVASGVNLTLANNGGPTLTHALLLGSLAIDAGNAAECLATDQRGFTRPNTCDIGAFEFNGIAPGGQTIRAPTLSSRPSPG